MSFLAPGMYYFLCNIINVLVWNEEKTEMGDSKHLQGI